MISADRNECERHLDRRDHTPFHLLGRCAKCVTHRLLCRNPGGGPVELRVDKSVRCAYTGFLDGTPGAERSLRGCICEGYPESLGRQQWSSPSETRMENSPLGNHITADQNKVVAFGWGCTRPWVPVGIKNLLLEAGLARLSIFF